MNAQPLTESIEGNPIRVGSYTLETLSTGMYENPLHCVREYVQNAYDAIRAARLAGDLTGDAGTVTISISSSPARPNLSIRDDGEGIVAAEAVATLLSIGASRKRSNMNAGFRGIGRLAGIAYCTTLRFTTSARGEDVASIVEFDCGRMRGYLRPGAEVQDVTEVIRSCAKAGARPAPADEHFFEAEMIGLTGIGVEFAEIERLVPYLRQVAPVDYSDRFGQAEKIRTFAKTLGSPIDIVEVETKYKRERTQILKAYDDVSPTADPKRPSTISDIERVHSEELGWFGWIGLSNFKGEITDDAVAGVRFRMKNIQIGSSDLIEQLGAELTTGGTEGRLQRYAVGEVFITNPAVVPNGRRDGFEDGKAWREIREDVKARVARRVVALVRNASNSRKTLRSIAQETSTVANSLNREWIDEADAARLQTIIDRLLGRLRPDKLTGGDPDEVGEHIAKLKALKDRLVELKSRPKPEPEPESDNTEQEDEAFEDPAQDQSEPDFSAWPPEAILDALHEVMVDELGADEAGRLMNLTHERLAG